MGIRIVACGMCGGGDSGPDSVEEALTRPVHGKTVWGEPATREAFFKMKAHEIWHRRQSEDARKRREFTGYAEIMDMRYKGGSK